MPSDIEAKQVHDNPTPDELRAFTEEMPQTRVTDFGNVNVQTKVTSRSSASTFVVGEEGSSSGKVISREEFDRIAAMQDEYIRGQEMVVVGYIGNDDEFKVAARLTIEKANANIAGMQQKLYFPPDGAEPEVQVIYTPNPSMCRCLRATGPRPEAPGRRVPRRPSAGRVTSPRAPLIGAQTRSVPSKSRPCPPRSGLPVVNTGLCVVRQYPARGPWPAPGRPSCFPRDPPAMKMTRRRLAAWFVVSTFCLVAAVALAGPFLPWLTPGPRSWARGASSRSSRTSRRATPGRGRRPCAALADGRHATPPGRSRSGPSPTAPGRGRRRPASRRVAVDGVAPAPRSTGRP